jgi:branched-chain amino acid aminotransferase
VKVKVETNYVRASEGGVGFAKAAGNYGAAMLPTKLAQDKGYNQVIWTDAKEHKYVEESGSMNLMFVINGKLLTPSLTESKLAGITRDSILKLAAKWNIPAEQRDITIEEVIKAAKDKTLEEAFGCGTAANIAHIDRINYEGTDYILPPVPTRTISNKIGSYLEDLKTGKVKDEMGWMVAV